MKGNDRIIEQPEEKELEKAKIFEQNKAKLFKILRQWIRIVALFTLFATVCYGNRDRSRFLLTKSVKDIFHRFDKVRDRH